MTARRAWRGAAFAGAILTVPVAAAAAGSVDARGLFVAAALAGFGCTVALVRLGPPSLRVILYLAVAFRLVWFPVGPTLSDDGYRYAWDGRLVADGVNPYEHRPDDPALRAYRGTPAYGGLNSGNWYSVYPPVSQWIFGLASRITDGSWPGTWYVIKGMVTAADLAAVLLLARMTTPGAVMLYAWHPAVLVGGAGQGHTDALVPVFLVLTVLAARRKRPAAAGAALAGGGLVKLVPFAAAPWLLLRLGSRAGAAFAATVVLVSLPFAASYVVPHVMTSLDLYVRLFEFNAGPYYAVKEGLRWLTGDDWSKQLGPFLRGVFGVAAVAIHAVALRRRWTTERVLYGLLAVYLLTATTVHPWYFLGLLAMIALRERPSWAWQWIAAWSLGTYLLYTGGPYWPFVWLAWAGGALLALWPLRARLLRPLLRWRAHRKADLLLAMLDGEDPGSMLDLGGAEGYVAEAIEERTGRPVRVVDLRPSGRDTHDDLVYDGRRVPVADRSVDTVLLCYVLHHADDAGRLLDEALRVARRRVVILESVLPAEEGGRLFVRLDRLAGRLRGRNPSEPGWRTLDHRTADAWRGAIGRHGGVVLRERALPGRLHRRHLFLVRPDASGEPANENFDGLVV